MKREIKEDIIKNLIFLMIRYVLYVENLLNLFEKKYCSDQCAKKARTIYVKENSDQYYKDHKEDIICKVKASKKNKRERDHKYEICKSNTGFNKTNR